MFGSESQTSQMVAMFGVLVLFGVANLIVWSHTQDSFRQKLHRPVVNVHEQHQNPEFKNFIVNPTTTSTTTTTTATTTTATKRIDKQLTLGMAVRLPHRNITSFLVSLTRATNDAQLRNQHVTLFSDVDTIAALESVFPSVEWILDKEAYTFHPSNQRYFMYRDYVKQHGEKYSHIQIADVRDTMFLKDPFQSFNLSSGLVQAFLEEPSRHIGAGDFNTLWVRQCYGTAVLAEIQRKIVSCSGYLLGTSAAVTEYLDLMTHELETRKSCESNGIDQGIHNVLLRHSKLGKPSLFEIHENQGEVFTMGYMEKTEETVEAIEQQKPAVVHQYDRHPLMISWVLGKTS